jgi:chloride channel protein, CIC family
MNETQAKWIRLTLLGVLSGVLGGGVVLLFHFAIDLGQSLFLPPGHSGNYEGLDAWQRLVLPVAGGLALGIAWDLLPAAHRQVGITHLLRRLQTPGGERLPWPNLVVQFLGALAAILSGHSVDKEGPSVHIGAASANLVGQRLRQAAEDDVTLIACGGAAAIAAAFNTPLAGIIFVVEVLKIRYEVSRYLPVIVASVSGTVLSRLILCDSPAFDAAPHHLVGPWEFPWLILLGVSLGLLAVAFIHLTERVALRTGSWRATVTFPLAGLVVGILALWAPQVMGTSYDTLDALLLGETELGLGFVLALAVAKLLATGTAVGLRVPGGLIGPTLFMGGAAGAGFGMALELMLPMETASSGFYATVGMVAMMGATLRAPLAALTALLELTGNPNIILPGMLAVASAELTNRLVHGRDSVFDTLAKIASRR